MNAPGYRVIEHLTRTNRLDTYEVWSEERACSCVAKTLRPDQRDDERARAALVHEATRLIEFTHPHIVRGYELVTDPELLFVMETLDGETLAHLVDRNPSGLPPEDVAWLGLHLASALRYLHNRGLLHLDVKAGNVIAESGRAKLLDLSLARPPGNYKAGIGTWSNMAPEQARGGELGPAADVWGLGTVLYEAASGEYAFDDDSDESVDYPQLHEPPPSARGHVPDELAAVIDACLTVDPAGRPTLEEVMERLRPFAT
jgi:eukaryotic-like serine/threonine-protein kinase